MPRLLSLEHCARITTWNDIRRERQNARKAVSRTRIACFVAFNVALWTLLLVPVLFR